MNTIIVVLVALVVVPTVVVVYRNQRLSGHIAPIPLGDLVERATRAHDRPYGPDSDRVIDELSVLTRSDRK